MKVFKWLMVFFTAIVSFGTAAVEKTVFGEDWMVVKGEDVYELSSSAVNLENVRMKIDIQKVGNKCEATSAALVILLKKDDLLRIGSFQSDDYADIVLAGTSETPMLFEKVAGTLDVQNAMIYLSIDDYKTFINELKTASVYDVMVKSTDGLYYSHVFLSRGSFFKDAMTYAVDECMGKKK